MAFMSLLKYPIFKEDFSDCDIGNSYTTPPYHSTRYLVLIFFIALNT